MFYINLIIGCFLSSIGIGGGSIFILLNDIFNVEDHFTSMIYNLLMFIFVGIFASFKNIKIKNFDKNIFKKMILPCLFFAILGAFISTKIEIKNLRKYFSIFILVLGLYEIFSSLKNIKKEKNISSRKEN